MINYKEKMFSTPSFLIILPFFFSFGLLFELYFVEVLLLNQVFVHCQCDFSFLMLYRGLFIMINHALVQGMVCCNIVSRKRVVWDLKYL